MPTEIETRVMQMLSAIEVPRDAAGQIEAMGTEAVTVACEAALGTYEGIRDKVRTNAASVVAKMDHPQARETLALLLTDESPDVAIRALRGVARRRIDDQIPQVARVLAGPATPPLVAAEAVLALQAVGTARARDVLTAYENASIAEVPHRGSPVVRHALTGPAGRR